jgi:hypothetical protein
VLWGPVVFPHKPTVGYVDAVFNGVTGSLREAPLLASAVLNLYYHTVFNTQLSFFQKESTLYIVLRLRGGCRAA